MAQVWNPTPTDMSGQSRGMTITIPAGKRIFLKDQVHAGERITATQQVENLVEQLGRRGLIVVDEENPIPVDEGRRISLATYCEWIKENLSYFNELNIDLAGGGGKILRPSRELRELEQILKRIEPDGGEDKIITKADLDKLTSREEQAAIGALNRLQAMVQAGADAKQIAAILMQFNLDREGRAAALSGTPRTDGPDLERSLVEPQKPLGRRGRRGEKQPEGGGEE